MNIPQRLALCGVWSACLGLMAMWPTSDGTPTPRDEGPLPANQPQQILLIRHAEKTSDPRDVHLSREGKERAQALHRLFEASAQRPRPFPTPDFIFATRNTSQSSRPRESVEPLALDLQLKIHHEYTNHLEGDDRPGIKELAQALRQQPRYAGKTILICWHHGTLPDLARALAQRASNRSDLLPRLPHTWNKMVFDRVWQIDFDAAGKATWSDRPQRLLPGDSQE